MYGFLITDSTITSDAPAGTFSLGRPWQPSGDLKAVAQVVIRNTELPAAIKSAPWSDMSPTSWRTGRFFEYQNTGAGAGVNADRPQLTDTQAAQLTRFTYLAGKDGCNLYRSSTGTATTASTLVNTALLTASTTTYTDTKAANGTAYSYVLTAVDKAGNESPASAPVAVSPVGVPLPAHDILVAADGA